ncbi:flagellar export chaperone FliS [Conexibacter sp. DBS9H8]|uniref:flagellar export chaperone FliS n=1 Tax=Conexibacter sp. DBS9H8 TaxID=2937801 RepID=UPI00200BEE6A|nr:flagellar export chaperone FliS [Conexibacter sp. DBS9H8]
MSYLAPATNTAYQTSAVLTASQPQLLVMLYDGAHRFLLQAAHAMRNRQIEDAHRKLRRAELIINHLNASLDFEHGGTLAGQLAAIYGFSLRHLNAARLHRDPEEIEQVDRILAPLRDAWAQISL